MNARELREKNIEELQSELIELRKEQFNLRMQRATAQTEETHTLKNVRRDIARVKTILKQKAKVNSDNKNLDNKNPNDEIVAEGVSE